MAGGFIGEQDQGETIGSDVFRGVVSELGSLDLHHITDGFIGNLWGISRCLFLSVLFWGEMSVLWIMLPGLPLYALEWLLGTMPIWLPVALLVSAWKTWIWYAKSHYIASIDKILLEVKFPRDLVRSPRAMENVLTQMWTDSGLTTFLNRVWQGHVHPYWSLEIANIDGKVHMYIWCWKSWRALLESALYAHYPEVELVEVEDYASKFVYDPEKYETFATDWRLEPRNDAYPLKTYIDYELEKDPKEEYKIDPFAMVLEQMSNLRPDEQMWIQIIITQCLDKRRVPGGAWWETESRYVGVLRDEVNNLRKEATGDPNNPEEKWKQYARIQLYRYTQVIQAIDRNMGKLPFSVGVRGVYMADPAKFGSGGYTRLRWIWRPFGNPQYMNHLRPRRWANPFDYAWQDFRDVRWRLMNRRFFDAYRRRGYFYSPWIIPHNMMSTEDPRFDMASTDRGDYGPGIGTHPRQESRTAVEFADVSFAL